MMEDVISSEGNTGPPAKAARRSLATSEGSEEITGP